MAFGTGLQTIFSGAKDKIKVYRALWTKKQRTVLGNSRSDRSTDVPPEPGSAGVPGPEHRVAKPRPK